MPSFERLIVRRAIHMLELPPDEKLTLASWILNGCDESQLFEIAELAQRFLRPRSSKESRQAFVRKILRMGSPCQKEGAD